MECDPAIQVVRLRHFNGEGNLKAFADVAIGDFVVNGLRILEGKNGLFVGMPQKAKDGKWFNIFSAATKEARLRLTTAVLAAYQE